MTPPNKPELFLSLIKANKGIIYKVTNSYCKDLEDRKDLAQEIIIQLWKAFENYNHHFKYSTWMYRIALNVAISFNRKETTRQLLSTPLTEAIFEFSDSDVPDEKETDLVILQQAISQLPDLDKALVLLYLEEKTHREIAQIIGISETNVATKISRIKNALKQKFTQIKKQ